MSKPTTLAPPPDAQGVTRSVVVNEKTPHGAPREGLCLLMSAATGVSVVRLAHDSTSILGRGADADIVIDDGSVSRHHARLVVGDRVMLIDLGSSNGTRVDGRRIAKGEEVGLRVGSSFDLGAATVVLQRAHGFLGDEAPPLKVERPRPRATTRAAGSDEPVVRDEAMRRIYALLELIAPSPLSVLILGETGTGKEVFAEAVHKASSRDTRPFLQLNCAAIPETLLEGELFGYERGAFTGATQAKAGLFESAESGTVFLDEIGEVPMNTQAKLLRVLETGEVMRIGSLKPKRIDVRFVSATNRDLRALIVEGRFRADLYFRLNGISITLPPLRKRRADVVPLAELFVRRVAGRLGRAAPEVSQHAARALERQPWPGNVRELRNVIERAVVMCPGNILELEHLMLSEQDDAEAGDAPESLDSGSLKPPSLGSLRAAAPSDVTGRFRIPSFSDAPSPRESLTAQLAALEKQSILDALEKTAGNQSKAAKLLGITRRVLISRLDQYGIARPRKGQD